MVVFDTDAESELNVRGTSVVNNAPGAVWVVVNADVGSTANIVNSTFADNVNTDYVFAALTASTVNLQEVIVDGAVGGNNLVSCAHLSGLYSS